MVQGPLVLPRREHNRHKHLLRSASLGLGIAVVVVVVEDSTMEMMIGQEGFLGVVDVEVEGEAGGMKLKVLWIAEEGNLVVPGHLRLLLEVDLAEVGPGVRNRGQSLEAAKRVEGGSRELIVRREEHRG